MKGEAMQRGIRILAAAASLALVMVGCSSGGDSAGGGDGAQGGTLRIGTSSRIDSLNPFVAFNQDAYTTFMYIYPFLVQYDENLEFAPDFATDWETSEDGLTWTFHTIEGAKWSDGEPLTAEDAAWTINTSIKYKSGATANASGLIAHIDSAEAPDPNTLVVHYEDPVGNVLSQFQQLAILPEHVWSQYETNEGKDLKTFKNEAPIVSGGPFMLTEFKKNDIALFETNPNFYGPEPRVDGFGLKMYTNDDTLINALKQDELDLIESVPPTGIETLESSGFVVEQIQGVTENDFIISSNPKKLDHRELLDPKLREAFAHAIDRDQIVEVAWLGTAEPATTFIPPATGEWHNSELEPETFDIDLANEMLDELGFERGADGVRVAGDHKMEYEVIVPSDLTGVDRTFQIIQADFKDIGVELIQKSLDSSAAFDAIGAPNYKYLEFDLAMWDWVPLIDPDFMLSVLTCDQFGGWNDSGYCNPEYDRLYQQQGVTLDEDERRDIVWEMQEMIFNDRPYIMLNYESWIYGHSKNWTGFVPSPQGVFNSLSKQSLIEAHQV
jgi:peptide/nickel transport system substrate-binding protein